MVGGSGVSWTFKKAAKKLIAQTCGSFSWNWNPTSSSSSRRNQTHDFFQDDDVLPTTSASNNNNAAAILHLVNVNSIANNTCSVAKNICSICLDPLNYSSGGSPCPAIFTAQCSHAFHFSCISSNVRHGSVTCPICRAHWTQLPRNLNSRCSLQSSNQSDPVLQILDDSIASFRVHRRSFLLSARYDDDDPVQPDHTSHRHHRLHISLVPLHISPRSSIRLFPHIKSGVKLCPSPLLVESSSPASDHLSSSGDHHPCISAAASVSVRAYVCVRLEHQPATDLVLVASPNGPHLRLMKQAMALVILSLRPEDRLSIVTYSSAAARMFPLRRMTSYGKRTALQVIDRLFYMGSADPTVGLKKGIKVLNDRVYRNPESYILHLSDSPTWSYCNLGSMEAAVRIHRFHVGFGFGTSHGFVMHEFEEFLAGMLGGAVRDIQLKIKGDTRIIKLGELRGGEERRVPLIMRKSAQYCVEYSYIEGGSGSEERNNQIRTGEMLIGIPEQSERGDDDEGLDMSNEGGNGGRTSSAESWEYHDTFMARRWAKHLHGNRL